MLAGLLIIGCIGCTSSKKNTSKTGEAMTPVNPTVPLTGTYWRQNELMGKPLETYTGKKEIHIQFIQEGNVVKGFGGCNGFGGNYTTKNDFNISMNNIISTMMACPDLDIENKLFNVLKTADSYYIRADTLSLNKARMATVAKFVKE